MQPSELRKIVSRLQKLFQLVQGLSAGKILHINRLTVLKFLCEDQEAAIRFSLYILKAVQLRIEETNDLSGTQHNKLIYYKEILKEAITELQDYIETPISERYRTKRAMLLMNIERNGEWNILLEPKNIEAFIIKQAIDCIVYSSPSYGYQMAKAFAGFEHKQSDQRLRPEAAPMVEYMGDFWCQYYFAKNLVEWYGVSKPAVQ